MQKSVVGWIFGLFWKAFWHNFRKNTHQNFYSIFSAKIFLTARFSDGPRRTGNHPSAKAARADFGGMDQAKCLDRLADAPDVGPGALSRMRGAKRPDLFLRRNLMGRIHFLQGCVEQYIVDVSIPNTVSFLLFSSKIDTKSCG